MENKQFSLAALYEIDDSYDSDRFLKLRIRVMHEGKNYNGSTFDVEGMEDAEASISNVPILANVVFDKDGLPDFGGHDMSIEQDVMADDGSYRIMYKEQPIGVVPETNSYEIAEFEGKKYVYVDAYVWRGYSNYAEDLILQNKTTDISMEVNVDSSEFSEQEQSLLIKKFKFTGITLLGGNHMPAMANASAKVEQFSIKENDAKLEELLSALRTDRIAFSKDGEDELNKEKEKEILENVSEEEVEEPTEEVEIPEEEIPEDDATELPNEDTETSEVLEANVFATTYKEKREALENALDPIIEKDENDRVISTTYFWIMDFDDEYVYVNKSFYSDSDSEEEYGRFKYSFDESTKKATISDAFEKMVVRWLTVEESNELDSSREEMEVELSSLREFKRDIETFKIFNQFKDLENIEAFKNLKEDNAKYSLDELKRECYVIRGMQVPFEQENDDKHTVHKIPVKTVKSIEIDTAPYGGIFEKFDIHVNVQQEGK